MMRALLHRRILPIIKQFRGNRRFFLANATPAKDVVKFVNLPSVRVLTLLGFLWPLKKEEPKIEPKIHTSLENSLIEADQLFDNGQFNECSEYLKNLQSRHHNNVEILWRLSRALYQMAARPKIDNNTKHQLATEAFDVITEALKLNDNHFAVHKWMSVILDIKSSCIGTSERIKNLEVVKKHMLRAVEINPSDATTLYMLGEWCYGIAELPWYQRRIAQTIYAKPPESSFEEALSYFTKAEVVEPSFYSMNWLMLGKTYYKLGNIDAAKHYLSLARSYPARTNDDHEANKQAQELLKQLG